MPELRVKHFAQVRTGKLFFQDYELWNKNLLYLEAKAVFVTIEKFVAKRTTPMNNYYWGVVLKMLSERWGYTPKECHAICKGRFLIIHGEDGKPDRIGSTKKLSKDDFWEYIENIRDWAAQEFQTPIPDPDKVAFETPAPVEE